MNLWFARNSDNEIVSILDSRKEITYHCPICTSKVIPKALESKKKTPHFAHVDVSKCNGEAMIHWWYKNKFIQSGDTFKIVTDNEIEFTCKDFDTEVTYQLENGTYRPDLVVYTECGQEIIFEMANTNKKMVKDYIDRWLELGKIVVEVDIKSLYSSNNKRFNALYYNGKCFNFNKRDGGYYNNVGKLKEEMKSNGKYNIELTKGLDWFWDELLRYKNKEINIKEIIHKIDIMSSEIPDFHEKLTVIMSSSLCVNFKEKYKYMMDFYKFESQLEMGSFIRNVIKVFNQQNNPFKISLNRQSVKTFKGKWWNGKKVETVDYYFYYIDLIDTKENRLKKRINLSNFIMSLNESTELLDYLDRKLKVKEMVD